MTVNYLSAQDFLDEGYLQEVNRRTLHPLGLALEARGEWTRDDVVEQVKLLIEGGGAPALAQAHQAGHLSDSYEVIWEFLQAIAADHWILGGVWDYRDDPEGMIFAEGVLSTEKGQNVARLEKQRYKARMDALGYWVQPCPGVID